MCDYRWFDLKFCTPYIYLSVSKVGLITQYSILITAGNYNTDNIYLFLVSVHNPRVNCTTVTVVPIQMISSNEVQQMELFYRDIK